MDLNCNHFYDNVCLMPSKVILVFDGLDELKVDDASLAEEIAVNSHNDVMPILLIFKQLVKGELLPEVTVLTTSRPTAEHIYTHFEFDREVEILGFHEEQIKNYVEKFCCNDTGKSSKIWNVIKQSPELLSLCYIPVNSYIVCLSLMESFKLMKGIELKVKMTRQIQLQCCTKELLIFYCSNTIRSTKIHKFRKIILSQSFLRCFSVTWTSSKKSRGME